MRYSINNDASFSHAVTENASTKPSQNIYTPGPVGEKKQKRQQTLAVATMYC